ncbi:hypothetical protein T03_15258 [Trichinella britovi]|uniref:CCHC-type domain-containing protein n=1 Tax=Trichinella britovi TaxID=45882 RepID=A0A0V1CBJ4_TRIBR|nr:hypothetical protein T03_15258 [Trichinella britovi]
MEEAIWAADALQTEMELNLEGEERQFAIDDWATATELGDPECPDRVARRTRYGHRQRQFWKAICQGRKREVAGGNAPECFRESVGIFPSFWAQFKAGIHNRSELNDTTKFTYLIFITEGTARSAIERIPHTLKNYSQAVDILKTRFGRPRLAIREHVAALWRASACREMTAQGIQSLVDEVTKHLHWLTALDRDSFAGRLSVSEALMLMLHDNFAPALIRAWDKNTGDPACQVNQRRYGIIGRKVGASNVLEETVASQVNARNARGIASRLQQPHWRGEHKAAACEKFFIRGPVQEEGHGTSQAKSKGVCFKCLENDHWARGCRGGRHCGVDVCHQVHHRLLHPPSTKESPQSPGSDCAYQSLLVARSTPGVRPCSRLRAGRKPRGGKLPLRHGD